MGVPKSVRRNLILIIALALVGILLSGYLFYTKVANVRSFCDFSPELSCDAVSQSPYSEFPANSGIPIAGLGIIAFLLYIIAAGLLLKDRGFLGIGTKALHTLLLLLGVFSLLFYVYLTYLELYVIYAICPLCVITFIITILMFLLIVQNVRAIRRKP